jgi:hypothetical protein
MNSIAARQAQSEMVRCRRRRAGAAGSKGSTIATACPAQGHQQGSVVMSGSSETDSRGQGLVWEE